jgi:hypothetical protein
MVSFRLWLPYFLQTAPEEEAGLIPMSIWKNRLEEENLAWNKMPIIEPEGSHFTASAIYSC